MRNNNYVKDLQELAFKLRKHRQEKGMAQKDMAKLLHIDRSTYTYYETAYTLPTIFTLIQIAEILNIELTELISLKKDLLI